MNHVQPEILIDIDIQKHNLFKLLFRYIWNSRPTPVKAFIQLRPDDPQYHVQSSEIIFKPTDLPSFETVGNSAGALQVGVTLVFFFWRVTALRFYSMKIKSWSFVC